MKKRIAVIFLVTILVLTLFLFSVNQVLAEGNVCCEKLTSGQFCQNAPQTSCDPSYKSAPTSCDSTQFCSTGTCVDNSEGICETGVAQTVCNSQGGFWDSRASSELAQCKLGCCKLGNEASYVTQARCKILSSLYGLQTSFDSSINSELDCIATAGGDEKGACAYESGSERTCKLLTRTDCNVLKGDTANSNVQFYAGTLCSDETLGTNCGPSKQTTMVPGQDEVYFIDTCGNLANIYDASKVNDKSYWSKIVDKRDSCGAGYNNANSASCGNCDYYRGSTASLYKKGDPVKPQYGDYVCKDLGCTYNGVKYQHGESWCGISPGAGNITDPKQDGNYSYLVGKTSVSSPDFTKINLPGSTYIRFTCYNGEVTPENCYDGRQKVCVESDLPITKQDGTPGVFRNAVCKQNLWTSCYDQTDEASCLDREARDCKWTPSLEDKKKFGNLCFINLPIIGNALCPFYYNELLNSQTTTDSHTDGYCVPINTPGFDFWNGSGNGENMCSLGTIACQYETKTSVIGGDSVKSGEECINSKNEVNPVWIQSMAYRCMQIGDCGPKTNYLGQPGEMQVVVEKKFGENQAVGYFVKSDGVNVLVPAPGGKTQILSFKDFFKF